MVSSRSVQAVRRAMNELREEVNPFPWRLKQPFVAEFACCMQIQSRWRLQEFIVSGEICP
jgi:hypothetical protein